MSGLNRQFGTSGTIEPHAFMAWVFEAVIKMATIDEGEIDEAIHSSQENAGVRIERVNE